jgi:hypothetical protein
LGWLQRKTSKPTPVSFASLLQHWQYYLLPTELEKQLRSQVLVLKWTQARKSASKLFMKELALSRLERRVSGAQMRFPGSPHPRTFHMAPRLLLSRVTCLVSTTPANNLLWPEFQLLYRGRTQRAPPLLLRLHLQV